MKNLQFLTVILSVFGLVGCTAAGEAMSSNTNVSVGRGSSASDRTMTSTSNSSVAASAPVQRTKASGEAQNAPVPEEAPSQEKAIQQNAIARKIIRNADLILEAESPEESQRKITQIAESKNGFVVETQSSMSSADVTIRDTVTMTVRVPSEKFNESLDEIRAASKRVIEENLKGEDVTEEFVDAEARLRAKKALEAQILELMKQAKTLEDTIIVQEKIAEVRGEIEQIEGRMRFLENQSSLSTIKIRLQTSGTRARTARDLLINCRKPSATDFLRLPALLFFVRAIVALLPFLLLIVLPIALLMRYFVKRKNNQNQKPAKRNRQEEIGDK